MTNRIAQDGRERSPSRGSSSSGSVDGSFSAASHVERLFVGGRPVVYDELRHQLFELNETADVIWQGLTSDAGEAAAAAGLSALGVEPAEARSYVREASHCWMTAGYMAPLSAIQALARDPDDLRRLVIDEVAMEVAFHGLSAATCDLVAGVLSGPGTASDRIAVVAHQGLFLLFVNGDFRCACREDHLAPQLKATITAHYMSRFGQGFLAHGAMLFRETGNLILSGCPGAGKSTLALALSAAGWAFGADDIVRVYPDGRASPVTFAACLKSGAWPLISPLWPQVEALRRWVRDDGQTVRYFTPPKPAARRRCAMDAIVVLARSPGAAVALEPISPLTALQALLEGAHSARWSVTGKDLRTLAARLEGARCRRLTYCDLGEAVQALEHLHAGPA